MVCICMKTFSFRQLWLLFEGVTVTEREAYCMPVMSYRQTDIIIFIFDQPQHKNTTFS